MTELTLAVINTKVANAEKELTAARERVEDGAAREYQAERLADLVNEVARAEGELSVVATVKSVFDYFVREMADARDISWRDEVTARLLAGADDEWSGRTNDVRRARYDGVRRAARRLLDRYDA